ncbi:MAG: acyltransferase [Lachnospiraceae bacterium]|nr:acyltransferase [Lachnospiraceae bacterium]
MTHNRKVHLDLLRILAILLVIFNHMLGYTEYMHNTGVRFGIYVVPSIITRINVPLFWMISGALLLPKADSIKNVLKHRVSRIALALLSTGAFLYLLEEFPDISLTDFIIKLFSNGIEESYWFLYTYLGILFVLPYLQKMVKNFSQKDFLYFLALHAIFCSIIPMLRYISQSQYGVAFDVALPLPIIAENALFFFVMGYYLENVLDISQLTPKKLSVLACIAIIAIGISAAFTYHQGIHTGYTQTYLSLFDYALAIATFIFIKYFFFKTKLSDINTSLCSFLCRIGELTFGIYLLDPFLKHFLYKAFENALEPALPTIICSIIWTCFSMIVCSIICFLLKKLPFFKVIL